jgi:glycosyltransferase involved in cell wall biosynthesis
LFLLNSSCQESFLKIVLGVPWFLPTSIGGTEVYVAGLAEELQTLGIECVVAVPSTDGKATTSTYRNIRTFHYPGPWLDAPTQSFLDSASADGFRDWLSSERPDVYHQHDWSPNCGLTHLQAAKGLGIPTFITIHLPKLLCIRGTMIYEGISQCDGRIIEQRCAKCFMQARGVPIKLGAALAKVPTGVATKLSHIPGLDRIFAGKLRASKSANGLKSLVDAADCIVTVSQWMRTALLLNGVPEGKTFFIKSGVDPEIAAAACSAQRPSSGPKLRIGFLGRWNEAKGLHVLLAALERLPKALQISLKILGMGGEDKAGIAYREKMEKAVAGHPQYQILSNQPRTAVNEFYENIDILAVPSQWLENAPLVVFEANAWKVPVVGSDLGGIREMVRHQVDGLLVPHDHVDAWAEALRQVAQDPTILQRFRENIGPARTMRDTAHDMVDLYRRRVNL